MAGGHEEIRTVAGEAMSKHCWYCSGCNVVVFLPWLSANPGQLGFETVIREVEQPCKVCQATRVFCRVTE